MVCYSYSLIWEGEGLRHGYLQPMKREKGLKRVVSSELEIYYEELSEQSIRTVFVSIPD